MQVGVPEVGTGRGFPLLHSPSIVELAVLHKRKPRRVDAARLTLRLLCRDANPALPLFSAAGTVLHKTASLTRLIFGVTLYIYAS